jgi:SAM-dependent methyltransferase
MTNASLARLRHNVRARAMTTTERVLPRGAVERVRDVRLALKAGERRRTQRIFEQAGGDPKYLPADALEGLQQRYPPPPDYAYDAGALEARGRDRAAELIALPSGASAVSFLEVGCWDGMVSWALASLGKKTTAVDNRSEGFDPRARDAGVDLRQMDAENLEFPDESFDFIFSYDVFEHLARPDRAFAEIIRVTKPGGHVWLHFGPLYLSPYGEHAYRSITVPYCQVLWPENVINDFARARQLAEIDHSHVNRWRIGQFRALWDEHSARLERVRYHEHYNLDHLDLIRRYPSCFRSETADFEDFIVAWVEALFTKVM